MAREARRRYNEASQMVEAMRQSNERTRERAREVEAVMGEVEAVRRQYDETMRQRNERTRERMREVEAVPRQYDENAIRALRRPSTVRLELSWPIPRASCQHSWARAACIPS